MKPEFVGIQIRVDSLEVDFRGRNMHGDRISLTGYITKVIGDQLMGGYSVLHFGRYKNFVLTPIMEDSPDFPAQIELPPPSLPGGINGL